MRSRWLSTFTLIGVLLIVLGIVGFVMPHFVYDPGQISDHHEPIYYLLVGVLMVLNGLLTPPAQEEPVKRASESSSAAGAPKSKANRQATVSTAADKKRADQSGS